VELGQTLRQIAVELGQTLRQIAVELGQTLRQIAVDLGQTLEEETLEDLTEEVLVTFRVHSVINLGLIPVLDF
jgi:hypothetical protein